MAIPVCEKEFLNSPIWFYNILLNYDVSLHNLVVLIVTILTSPRLSKTEFICKSYGALYLPLDLPRSWPGVSGHTGVSGPKYRSLRSLFFAAVCLLRCGTVWGSGVPPEKDRSLRPTGVSGPRTRKLRPQFFSALLHLCGAPLDRGPELPRRVPGVSVLAGVSGTKDRNLRHPR